MELEIKLAGMKRATLTYCNRMTAKAEEISLKGEVEEVLSVARSCFTMLEAVEDEVRDLLDREGSDLWRRQESDEFRAFLMNMDDQFRKCVHRAIFTAYLRDQNAEA
jgi:hypothetical protein